MNNLFKGLIVGLVLVLTSPANASGTYCVSVKYGSVLHNGPGVKYPAVTTLFPADLLEVSSGTCRGKVCDDSGQWTFVEEVSRIDGPSGTLTQGWVWSSFVKQTECPGQGRIARDKKIGAGWETAAIKRAEEEAVWKWKFFKHFDGSWVNPQAAQDVIIIGNEEVEVFEGLCVVQRVER